MNIRRSIHFAGSSIAVESEDEKSSALCDFLFGDVYTDDDENAHTTFRLSFRGATESYYCFRNDEPMYVGQNEGNMLRDIMDKAIYAIADKAAGGLLLHAAAVRWGNLVVLLPGSSGSGKSSLSSWLAHNGFGYLTDELIFIPFEGQAIEAFTRPLNIKTPGVPIVSRFVDLKVNAGLIKRGGMSTLIPHRLVNPRFEKTNNVKSGLIVFPKYLAGGETKFRALSEAEAAQHLMGNLVNARNIEGHGFLQATQFIRSTPAYHLLYSDFGDVADRLRLMLEGQPAGRPASSDTRRFLAAP